MWHPQAESDPPDWEGHWLTRLLIPWVYPLGMIALGIVLLMSR
jgi:hypothetical protein